MFDRDDAFRPVVYRRMAWAAAVASVSVCLVALLILSNLDPDAHGAACPKASVGAWNMLVIVSLAALWACVQAALAHRQSKKLADHVARTGDRPKIYGLGAPIPTSFNLFFIVFGCAWTMFCAIPIIVIAVNCTFVF